MDFEKIARKMLPGWELSLAFVSPTVAKRLNRKLRSKSYTPNVLSYRAGPKHGEVIICKKVAAREAKAYGHSPEEHVLFLFIHGLLHLKGMAHGSTMEKREQSLLARYGGEYRRVSTHGQKNRNRHRHRHLSGEDRRTRRSHR